MYNRTVIVSWMCRVVGAGVCAAVLTACGGEQSAAPSSAAAASSVAVSSAAKVDVDPCTLLSAPELAGYLAGGKPDGTRQDESGKAVCAWGDGEFRSVRLSVWGAGADELGKQAIRTVDLNGGKGYVTVDEEYDCAIGGTAGGTAVVVEIISVDKPQWCAEAGATLTAVLGKLRK